MIIKKVHELNIVSGEYDICKLDFIDKVLSNNVTNVIYFVKNQILYGYISLNMISSSDVSPDEIYVNRKLNSIKSNDSNWYKKLKRYRSSGGGSANS